MSLQELVNNFGIEKEYTDMEKNESKKLSEVLKDRRYFLLLKFLEDNHIDTTGDLKKIGSINYNTLRAKIPSLQGVGEDKTDLFLNKLDEIRNTKYHNNYINRSEYGTNYGIIGDKEKWHIEVNKKVINDLEYIDIRKFGPNGIIGKGVSIRLDYLEKFKSIINSIDCCNINTDKELKTLSNSSLKNNSLKSLILKNEDHLLNKLGEKYELSIKLFKKKIESLKNDGDIVKFLNNDSILDIKKEQYDEIHQRGLETAVDIMNNYDKSQLKYTLVDDLYVGEEVNTITLCALANNFNLMLGMYYNEKDDILILKSQTENGEYNDKWINDDEFLYYLQSEDDENYKSLEFSHKPNQICRDIVLKLNLHTKVYLFIRKNKKEDYIFCGEFNPIKFLNNNKCIVITKR